MELRAVDLSNHSRLGGSLAGACSRSVCGLSGCLSHNDRLVVSAW